jgi:hypothetical protein
MKVKQLVELLSQFDPESTVEVAFPVTDIVGVHFRDIADDITVEELQRFDGTHPLISINGAHLLED